jgi:hypothetical protein
MAAVKGPQSSIDPAGLRFRKQREAREHSNHQWPEASKPHNDGDSCLPLDRHHHSFFSLFLLALTVRPSVIPPNHTEPPSCSIAVSHIAPGNEKWHRSSGFVVPSGVSRVE